MAQGFRELEYTPKDFLNKFDKRYPAMQEEVGGLVRKAKESVMDLYGGFVVADNDYYAGEAVRSIRGGTYTLTQDYGQMAARVGSYTISANILEWGRKPGAKMPPETMKITEWMASRGLSTDTHGVLTMRKHIAKKGIKATKPLLRAFNMVTPVLQSKIGERLQNTMKKAGFNL